MQQKIWLITGVSSGLGKALANAVLDAGDIVVGTFRQPTQVSAFALAHPDRGYGLSMDLCATETISAAVHWVSEKFGRIDVLVNNAGFGLVGAVEETSAEETRRVFEANFFGTLTLTQAVLPMMRAQGSGHIVQISSHGGFKAFPGFGIYNASKFALEGFSEALAAEVAPLGIRVTIVQPGPFRTGFAGTSLAHAAALIPDYAMTAGAFRARMDAVNGKQEGDPDKGAAAILAHTQLSAPTLRLPLGKIALMTIGSKLDAVRADLEQMRAVSEAVVFES